MTVANGDLINIVVGKSVGRRSENIETLKNYDIKSADPK